MIRAAANTDTQECVSTTETEGVKFPKFREGKRPSTSSALAQPLAELQGGYLTLGWPKRLSPTQNGIVTVPLGFTALVWEGPGYVFLLSQSLLTKDWGGRVPPNQVPA